MTAPSHAAAGTAVVQQTVHGYASGHRLVRASVRLPAQGADAMLVLSDLSGPRPVKGFDTYLTGYPVPGTEWYAFARTWLAPEMPRPGCVWTHTLLVNLADLAHIQSLWRLAEYFRRPSGAAGREFEVPVAVPLTGEAPRGGPPLPMARAILRALYETPGASVLLGAPDAELFESLVLRVWDQQWPRLRRAFRFCTGALAPRTLLGRPLDLQVLPDLNVEVASREVPDACVLPRSILNGDAHVGAARDAWLDVLADDLAAADPDSAVRWWMRYHTVDASPPRAAVGPLVQILSVLQEFRSGQAPADDLVDVVASTFPHPDRGARLKITLFHPASAGPLLAFDDTRESEVLRALALCRLPEAYDAKALDLRNRATRLWRADREAADVLLGAIRAGRPNQLGECVLFGLCDAVAPEDVADVARQHPGVLYVLVHSRPALAARADVWIDPTLRNDVVLALGALEAERKPDVAVVASALGNAGPSVGPAVRDAGRVYGFRELVTAYLAVVVREPDDAVIARGVPSWWDLLADYPDALVAAAADAPRGTLLRMAAELLSPEQARAIPAAAWQAFAAGAPAAGATQAYAGDPEPLSPTAAALLFALALGVPARAGGEIAAASFPRLHDVVLRGALPARAWAWLDGLLPHLSWGRDWDRGERLRRGLMEAFATRPEWSPGALLGALCGTAAFEAAIAYGRESRTMRPLLNALAKYAAGNRVPLSVTERDALAGAVKKRYGRWLFTNVDWLG